MKIINTLSTESFHRWHDILFLKGFGFVGSKQLQLICNLLPKIIINNLKLSSTSSSGGKECDVEYIDEDKFFRIL
jgi:hypothetical protein